jgi:hypothetical protein
VYYQWEGTSPLPGPEKLLQEVMRQAAVDSGFDETTTSKLLNMVNPVVEPEQAKKMQKAYTNQLVKDVASTVRKDVNFTSEEYPALAKKMKDFGV